MASQIISASPLSAQSFASLASARDGWIPPHKGPVSRKMFPFDDVIMIKFIEHVTLVVIIPESKASWANVGQRRGTLNQRLANQHCCL